MNKKHPDILEGFGYKQELSRSLNIYHMIVFGLLFVIPVAPFGIYGFLVTASNGMVSLVYLIGCCTMIFTAFSYGQMAKAFPVAGSVYSYASKGLHPHIGFITGWAILLDYIMMPTLIYIVCGLSIHAVLPVLSVYEWSVIVILFITFFNTIGITHSARLAILALIAQFIILFIFIAFAVIAISHGVNHAKFSIDPIFNVKNFNIAMVMNAVSIAVLSFLGFDAISTLVEETKGGRDIVGRAAISVLVIAGSLFFITTYLAGILWPDFKLFKNIDLAFYEIASMAAGKWLLILTSLATAFSWAFAALTAQLAVSRILLSMSRDKNLPKMFSVVHKKFHTPYVATWFIAILSLIMAWLFKNDVELLTLLVNFGALTSFLILHVTVIYYYKVQQKSPHFYKHLLFPLIGFFTIGYVWWNLNSDIKIVGVIWLMIGVLYYICLIKFLRRDMSSIHISE